MPDWTYQTVFCPLLKRLPYATAQAIVFRSMGLLGRNPIGRAIISFMGHAKPSPDVAVSKAGLVFPGPCGLACGVDLQARAVSATSLFGFGLIEVGPIASSTTVGSATEWRDHGLSRDALVTALQQNSFRNDVPVILRLRFDSAADEACLSGVVRQFQGLVDGFSFSIHRDLPTDATTLDEQCTTLRRAGGKLFGVVDLDAGYSLTADSEFLCSLPMDGFILQNGTDSDGAGGRLGAEVVSEMQVAIETTRSVVPDRMLIARGGVEEPADALALLDAGADMVLVDSGFAVSGPGLPKRINGCVLSLTRQREDTVLETTDSVPETQRSWFWTFLLGLSLTIGGIMVLVVGWTRVLLPYDEEFLGMLRDEICGINPQLLPFMSHDRVTLAGTMLSLGPLYLSLAWFGDRLGMHWARVALLSSAFVGFLSFFLFLGFGYFDPFHAFVATLLFQLMTLCLRSSQSPSRIIEFDLHNSSAWRRAMWGQLLMIIHGAVVLVAGLVISSFGVTSVFVPEDLEFMQTTREALVDANPRLIPLVAHDRASFGGMLLSTGVTLFLSALWGWQRGRRWLWYTIVSSGTVAYTTTIIIHWAVGYTNLAHLLPAYLGLPFLWLGMGLSRRWMFEDASLQKDV